MISTGLKVLSLWLLFGVFGSAKSWAVEDVRSQARAYEGGKLNTLPDLQKYPKGPQRKEAFLNVIIPVIERQNRRILQEREWLLTMRAAKRWQTHELTTLQQLCQRYRLTCTTDLQNIRWEELLKRVDTLPTQLIVAQAATETGWGTSALAQRNRNLFGMRCKTKTCNAKSSAVTGYSVYASIDDSISDYLLNMNTHAAYRTLRDSRAGMRNKGKTVKAEHLVDKLGGYSELGSAYGKYLLTMLNNNETLVRQVQAAVSQRVTSS